MLFLPFIYVHNKTQCRISYKPNHLSTILLYVNTHLVAGLIPLVVLYRINPPFLVRDLIQVLLKVGGRHSPPPHPPQKRGAPEKIC